MVAAHGAGPWRESDAARPLHWWDERGLQLLARDLRDLLAQWSKAWGIQCDGAALCCQPAEASVTGHWFAFDAGGHAQAWLHLPEDNDAGLLGVIFPDAPVPGPLARAVAAACRQDAVARLAALLGLACRQVADAVPDAALALTGSGAVDAILPAPLSARLLLGAEPAARWRKGPRKTTQRRGEPLASATAALASRPLSLELELEGCELEVGALQGLQIGDVVRLNHGLQSPASVRHAGHRMCSAYLGRLGDRKAVELATGEVPR